MAKQTFSWVGACRQSLTRQVSFRCMQAESTQLWKSPIGYAPVTPMGVSASVCIAKVGVLGACQTAMFLCLRGVTGGGVDASRGVVQRR